MSEPKSYCCIECEGEVVLVEDAGTLEAYGYGYGTFVCQECRARSSYYGEGLKPCTPVEEKPKEVSDE